MTQTVVPYPQPVEDRSEAKPWAGQYEDASFLPGTAVRIWYTHLGTCYPLHWHNALEILVGEKEHYICQAEGVTYRVGPGEILLIPGGTLHTLSPEDGCNGFVYLLDLGFLDHIPSAARVLSVLSKPLHITEQSDPALHLSVYALLRKMREDYFSTNELRELLIDSNLLLVMEQLICHQAKQATGHSRFDKRREYNDLFHEIVVYINQHYMDNLLQKDIAKQWGISTHHFSRLFRQYTQHSFSGYLTLCRLNAAERLMNDASLSITDIAYRVGYNCSSAFSRAFRAVKGCAPTEYRQIHGQRLKKQQEE